MSINRIGKLWSILHNISTQEKPCYTIKKNYWFVEWEYSPQESNIHMRATCSGHSQPGSAEEGRGGLSPKSSAPSLKNQTTSDIAYTFIHSLIKMVLLPYERGQGLNLLQNARWHIDVEHSLRLPWSSHLPTGRPRTLTSKRCSFLSGFTLPTTYTHTLNIPLAMALDAPKSQLLPAPSPAVGP